MDKFIKAYLDRAREGMGERTPAEIEYDNVVVEALNQGHPIQEALAIAGAKYPGEALQWDLDTISDIAAHYDYLKQHMAILKKVEPNRA